MYVRTLFFMVQEEIIERDIHIERELQMINQMR